MSHTPCIVTNIRHDNGVEDTRRGPWRQRRNAGGLLGLKPSSVHHPRVAGNTAHYGASGNDQSPPFPQAPINGPFFFLSRLAHCLALLRLIPL